MKEVLEKLAGLIPAYFEAFFPLLSGPKRYMAVRLADEPSALRHALLFLAISFLLESVLKLPLTRGDPLLDMGTDAVFQLIMVMAYGGALFAAWRLVGATMDVQKFFTIHFYFAGILLLLESLVYLGMMGTLRAFDPALYNAMYAATAEGNILAFLTRHREQLLQNPAYRLSMLVQILGMIVIAGWIFAGWGAYRALGGVSRARSLAAAVLFALLCLPVTAIIFMIANALAK